VQIEERLIERAKRSGCQVSLSSGLPLFVK